LVREEAAAHRAGREAREPGPELAFHHREREPLAPLLRRLADAEQRLEAVAQRRDDLAVDLLVRLTEEPPPLGVPDDDEPAAGLDEHARRDLPGERARVLPVAVLRAERDGRPRERLADRGERRERGAHRD